MVHCFITHAMLFWHSISCLPVPVYVSVRHQLVLCRNGRMDGADLGYIGFLSHVLHCVITNLRYLENKSPSVSKFVQNSGLIIFHLCMLIAATCQLSSTEVDTQCNGLDHPW